MIKIILVNIYWRHRICQLLLGTFNAKFTQCFATQGLLFLLYQGETEA